MQTSPSVLFTSDLRIFFQEVIDEILEARGESPDPVVKQYILGLLEDSALGDRSVESAIGDPLAVQLSQALSSPPHERFTRLHKLGDGILLLGGLYQPHLRHAGLEDRYVATLGARAYSAAASLLSPSWDVALVGDSQVDLLSRMAHTFQACLCLLRDVSDTLVARSARTATDLTRLCERWLQHRSAHLARLLKSRGIRLDSFASGVA